MEGRFRYLVREIPGLGPEDARVQEVDDIAFFAFGQLGGEGLGEKDGRGQIDGELALDEAEIERAGDIFFVDGGIVDKQRQRADAAGRRRCSNTATTARSPVTMAASRRAGCRRRGRRFLPTP
jgi:hypothetical protein